MLSVNENIENQNKDVQFVRRNEHIAQEGGETVEKRMAKFKYSLTFVDD